MASSKLTFAECCRLDPRIKELFDDCQKIVDDGKAESFCANLIWFRKMKPRLLLLVGFNRPDGPDELLTSRAYDIVYRKCYEALPDCRGECGCIWG